MRKMDVAIQEATNQSNRDTALELHAKRYEFLRSNYLDKIGGEVEKCRCKVKAVVLTVDLAIKIFAGLSPKHKRFVKLGVALGFIDEGHNVARNQIFALASHIPHLIVGADPFQEMSKKSRMGAGCL